MSDSEQPPMDRKKFLKGVFALCVYAAQHGHADVREAAGDISSTASDRGGDSP